MYIVHCTSCDIKISFFTYDDMTYLLIECKVRILLYVTLTCTDFKKVM